MHGNTSSNHTYTNALRCLYAFGAPEDVHVYPGAATPLLRTAKHDPEIHGADGLGGVEGLPDHEYQGLLVRCEKLPLNIRATEAIARAVQAAWRGGRKTVIISSGPMTNIALFVSVYPDLLAGVEEIVFMGGGVGLGNRSAVAGSSIV